MNLENFFDNSKKAIVNEFNNDMSMCLVATTPDKIKNHEKLYNWKIQTLGKIRPTSAVVIIKPSGEKELWANNKYGEYRSAFL